MPNAVDDLVALVAQLKSAGIEVIKPESHETRRARGEASRLNRWASRRYSVPGMSRSAYWAGDNDMNPTSFFTRTRSLVAACARDASNLAGGAAATLGVGVIACAACCAAPLGLGALGLGGLASGAAFATLELPMAIGVALASAAGLIVWWRRRRVAAVCAPGCAAPGNSLADGSGAMCSPDGSCGCRPNREANVSPG